MFVCLFVCVCVYFLQILNAFKNYNKTYLDERGSAKHIFKQIINCNIFFLPMVLLYVYTVYICFIYII